MSKESGQGMSAFFTNASEPKPVPEQGQPTQRYRTSITLTVVDAERLELLRMHLRRQRGRGLTYSDVVSMALENLCQAEEIANPLTETAT